MSTPNVPSINVHVTSVTAEDLKEEEKAREKRRQIVAERIKDTLTISTDKAGTAGSGEASPPPKTQTTRHDQTKTAQTALKKAFEASGGEKPATKEMEGRLLELTEGRIIELGEQIIAMESEGEGQEETQHLRRVHSELIAARDAYLAAAETAEPEAPTATVQSASVGTQTGDQEETLWRQLESKLSLLGIETGGTREVEEVQGRLARFARTEATALKTRETEIKTEMTRLTERLKTASGPEKTEIENQLKVLKEELAAVGQRIQALKTSVANAGATIDNIIRLKAAKDLGIEIEEPARTVTRSQERRSATARTASARNATSSASQGSGAGVVTTASALSGGSDQAALSASGGGGGVIGTASAGGGTNAGEGLAFEGGPSANTVATLAANDFSGTTLAIATVGQNLKSEARKTDKMIKKLLQAALSGNWEAVRTALILLDKRASIITIGMGAQTIKAMQYYEKQMSVLSKSLGKLKVDESYSANLAKINSQMNLYSLNRQAIANFLRDTMTMREEVAGLTKSVLDANQRLISSIAR